MKEPVFEEPIIDNKQMSIFLSVCLCLSLSLFVFLILSKPEGIDHTFEPPLPDVPLCLSVSLSLTLAITLSHSVS